MLQVGGTTLPALSLGAVGFVATVAAFTWHARREIARVIASNPPLFPAPTTELTP